ncbi:MAG: hypothetical protein NT159_14660 [Proteobacteria bacterium]|nr:hypothetical protein [Pseudomonadota bacterium]
MNTTNKQSHWLAGIVAAIATLLVVGGPLTLAEHYAQAGVNVQGESNSLAQQAVQTVRQHS